MVNMMGSSIDAPVASEKTRALTCTTVKMIRPLLQG